MIKILLFATDQRDWAGGLYYIKNVAFQLTQNKYIMDNYEIDILTTEKNKKVFTSLIPLVKVFCLKKPEQYLKEKKLLFCLTHRIKFVFPSEEERLIKFGIQPIYWIPDFQHNWMPENFSTDEIEHRNMLFRRSVNNKIPLILSSYSCLDDYHKFYSKEKENVYVMHFVSYISNEIYEINAQYENDVLNKYHLKRHEYICVANQFWKHKNHIIVLKSLKKIVESGNSNIKIVFTGSPKDYRNSAYYNEILSYINDDAISKYIQILGFINRSEQICILKNSSFILQPSLFEGWGTVVEDAKVLDKRILLSDIPVHREQMNSKCVMFNPYDENELASKIIGMSQDIIENEDVNDGIEDMMKKAKEYSKSFENLLIDFHNK